MKNVLSTQRKVALAASYTLALSALASPAFAGPGGLIVAAEKTWIGRVITLILIVILSPLIIIDAIQRARAIKRTMAALDQLSRTHPQYNWLSFTDTALAAFNWIWTAWDNEKMEQAEEFTTHWYVKNQQMHLDTLSQKGLTNHCSVKKIQQVKPLLVQHNPGTNGNCEGSRLVVMIDAVVVDYLEDSNGKFITGKKEPSDQRYVWTFMYEDGAWKVNRIEDGVTVWDYLKLENQIDITPAQATTW